MTFDPGKVKYNGIRRFHFSRIKGHPSEVVLKLPV